MKLSIVIPIYNEERTIECLLHRVLQVRLPMAREIIVVDDGSTDATGELVREFVARQSPAVPAEFRLITRANGGKGAAVRDGFLASTGEIVIVQDGDLEYDPQDYLRCIEPIVKGAAQVVYGSRERRRGNAYSALRFYLGGLLVTHWINILYHAQLTDEPTCYKTFAGNLIRHLPFENNDFGWEPEVTAKLLRLGYEIVEVPISYVPRHVAEGKKINYRDGLKALYLAWIWRFRSLKNCADLKRSAAGGKRPDPNGR